ncbi:MAG: low molecular weight protein-tyrosine-phosphatase [Planctomycetota bacterium]
MSDQRQASVLFVCMGNICRSPAGEGVFRDLVDKRGVADTVEIDSAGTIGYHTGNPADGRMRAAAKRRGYDLTSRARQVTRDDLERFDLVVAMDQDNYDDLVALNSAERGRVRMLGSFLPEADGDGSPLGPDVPDPYYGGADGFETVLDMIERACPAILDALTRPTDAR